MKNKFIPLLVILSMTTQVISASGTDESVQKKPSVVTPKKITRVQRVDKPLPSDNI